MVVEHHKPHAPKYIVFSGDVNSVTERVFTGKKFLVIIQQPLFDVRSESRYTLQIEENVVVAPGLALCGF